MIKQWRKYNMKKISVFILGLVALALFAGLSDAKESKTIAVLPFAIHSAEQLDYVKSGIWDMLLSRLTSGEAVQVVGKDRITQELEKLGKTDLTKADVYALGKTLNADYVVWGSITKIGNNISLDGKLLDVAVYTSPVGIFEQCRGMDEVIPKINNFARTISYHLEGKTPPAVTVAPVPAPVPQATVGPAPQAAATAQGEAINALKTPEGTYTAVINPDFIQGAQPLDRKGFWMTRRFPTYFKGMDIGDVNGNGLNEIVVIDGFNTMIFKKEGKDLKQLYKARGSKYDQYLAVDVADINANGTAEIIVTNMKGSRLYSFVLEYRDGEYVPIATDLKYFFRVINQSGTPVLIGQTQGIGKPFENPIYEIKWDGTTYSEGPRMYIPQGLSVYGLTMDSVDGSGNERVIALDEYDHIRIYKKTKKPIDKIEVFGGSDEMLWRSDEVFGGSSNYYDFDTTTPDDEVTGSIEPRTFINTRIHTYDIKQNGKQEIIIVKNISSVGRLFRNIRSFSSSEIYDFEWDGLGLSQNWKTKKIRGYVSDYQFKDVDNDGKKEIVLALVLSTGTMKPKSLLVAYDLKE